MSSKSNDEHSSSSPVSDIQNRKEAQKERSRSRSRDKDRGRYRQQREQYRGGKDNRKRQKVVKVPQIDNELISFRQFLTNQTEKISSEVAQKQYEVYKTQWEQKTNKRFFFLHKNEAWLQQKYNPQVLDAIERQRKERVIKSSQQFTNLFKNGYYDGIDLSVKQFNHLGFICNERDDEMQQFRQVSTITNSSGIPLNIQCVDINVSAKININQAPFFAFDPDANTIFIKAIPRTISKFDVFQIVGKLEGFQSITLSQPLKKLHFSRYCWISFTNQQCLKNAENAMNGLLIKGEPINFGHSLSRSRRIKILKKYPISRVITDAGVVKKLAAKLDNQCGVQDNILLKTQFPTAKKQLDTFLLYLRRVHAYDYYSSTSYPNQRALCLKLGRAFLRVEAEYEQVPDFPTIFKQMQIAAQNIIANGTQIPDYTSRLRQQVQKMVLKHISEAEQGTSIQQIRQRQIWQCIYCKKKFKSCQFVAKHIIMKHPENKDKHIDLIMEQAYNADPNKITNYQIGHEERDNSRSRRPGGFRRGRGRQYRDLDDPEAMQNEKQTSKPINFLDI